MAQIRVRPSKPMSALGAVVGFFFIIFGIGFTRQMWTAKDNPPWFVKIFPIVWTLIAASICIYHLSNLFRDRGVADRIVDTDESDSPLFRTEQRLKDLSNLRAKNLITEEEYQERRTVILNET
jgi:hypothetical protein